MLIRRRPAALSAAACSSSSMPLVVRAMSSMPGIAASMSHELVQVGPHQRLAAGEPQLVDAQRRRPRARSRSISSNVSSSSRGRNTTPSSGMQ